jgi:hypothetical protein
MLRKTFTLAAAIAPSLLVSLPAAAVPEASQLPFSAVVTWDFDAGYVCLTQDTLAAMARTAKIHRYRIVGNSQTYSYDIVPVSAVEIYPEGDGVVAEPVEVFPIEGLLEVAETDETGEWFAANTPVDDLGRGCVNGGIAGGIQALERMHEIDIRSNP